MKRMIMNFIIGLTFVSTLFAQQFQVGDVVNVNLNEPICSNSGGMGDDTWYLFDSDGESNGGDYNVIWLIFFASW